MSLSPPPSRDKDIFGTPWQKWFTLIQKAINGNLQVVTGTQKSALTATPGMIVYDTTLGKLCVYNGSAWETITSV